MAIAAAMLRRRVTPRAALVTLSAVALAVGAVAQVRMWATGHGLWFDELAVAVNLPTRTVLDLAGPLDHYQVAPWGWLVIEKLFFETFGPDERALRLPSLLGGLLVLALTAVIAYRALGWWAAAVAAVLLGGSPQLVRYAGELKQYTVEAAVALGLLLMGDDFARRVRSAGRPPWRVVAVAAAVTCVLVTLSYTALLVLAGVVAGLGCWLIAQRHWPALLTLVAGATPAMLVGAGLALHRLSLPMTPGQDSFFGTGMPAGRSLHQVLEWLPRMWAGFVRDPLGWRGTWWILLLAVGGIVALLARRRFHWAAMLAGVLAVAVAAAAVRAVPLADRVALYLVAPVILLVVAGAEGLGRGIIQVLRLPTWPAGVRLPRGVLPAVGVCAAAAVLVVAGPTLPTRVFADIPPRLDKLAIFDVGQRLRPGDVVLVYAGSDRLTRWYGGQAGVQPAGQLDLVPEGERCDRESVDAMLAGASRAWYLHGKRLGRHPSDFTARVTRELATRGQVIESRTFRHSPGSRGPGWVLVDLTAGPDHHPPRVTPKRKYACLIGLPASPALFPSRERPASAAGS